MLDGLEAEAARLALAASHTLSHAGKQAGTALRLRQASGSNNGKRPRSRGLNSRMQAASETALLFDWRQQTGAASGGGESGDGGVGSGGGGC